MNPADLAKSGTESGHQRAVMAMAALHVGKYPCLRWLHHIPNGGSRGDTAQSRAIQGGKLKADGVKKGVFDLMLPWANGGYHGLYIEMKKPGEIKNTTPEQKEFAQYLTDAGYAWRVCDNWEMAWDTIMQYVSWAPHYEQPQA